MEGRAAVMIVQPRRCTRELETGNTVVWEGRNTLKTLLTKCRVVHWTGFQNRKRQSLKKKLVKCKMCNSVNSNAPALTSHSVLSNET